VLVHEGKKPYKCQFCNYTCSKNHKLKKHVASIHEGKKPFKCEVCDYTSSQKVEGPEIEKVKN